MRKITEQAIQHFYDRTTWKSGADEVFMDKIRMQVVYQLYDTRLVCVEVGSSNIKLNFPPEWCTSTTAERLSNFAYRYGMGFVNRKAGQWLLNGKPVSGWVSYEEVMAERRKGA